MFVYQLLKWTSSSSTDDEEQQEEDENEEELDSEKREKIKSEFVSACTYLPMALNEDRVSHEDQLYFYARYKQVTCGKADPSKRPSMFDIIGREKFDAWAALGNMLTLKAMKQYVARLVSLNLGWDPNRKYNTGFGVRPSTMADAESNEVIFELDKDFGELMEALLVCEDRWLKLCDTESSGMSWEQLEWFATLNEGNIDKLKNLLSGNTGLVEERDENQLTALHWASDRGKLDLVDFLIDAGSDVNVQDYSGQTPLHYAVSCSHRSVVELLLKKGADPTIADFEGNCPLDVATDDAVIRRMLENAVPEIGTKT